MILAFHWRSMAGGDDHMKDLLDDEVLTLPQWLFILSCVAAAVLTFGLVRVDLYSPVSWAALTLLATGCVAIVRARTVFTAVAPLGALTALAALATWHIPRVIDQPFRFIADGEAAERLSIAVIPPAIVDFCTAAVIVGAAFGLVGYMFHRRSRFPGLWVSMGVAVPLAAFAVAFRRLRSLELDLAWAVFGIALASIGLVAATSVARAADYPGRETALGLYALGVMAAISLGASMSLNTTWLTVALAAQLPAAAWVQRRRAIKGLPVVMLLVAGLVLSRLVLLNFLPGPRLAIKADALWILYSYGVPAAAFALAAGLSWERGALHLSATLESGTVAILMALASLEIRYFVNGGTITGGEYSFLEASLNSIAWLTSGYCLYRRLRTSPRFVYLWGSRVLISLAAVQVVALQILTMNPLSNLISIGSFPVFNELFLAYAVPAMIALLLLREAVRQGHKTMGLLAVLAALMLVYIEVTFETRRLFHYPFP